MKPIEFEGKTAVITGAGSGMGLLASMELVRMGATVVMCDIDDARLRQAVEDVAAAGRGLPALPGLCTCEGRAPSQPDSFVSGRAVAPRPPDSCIAACNGRAIACPCDVRRYADAEKAAALAVSETGRVDILIPFAGGYEPRMCQSVVPFFEQPVEVLDWGIDVNLKGAIYFARACMPAMVKGGNGGVICCIGSTSGFEGDAKGAMYGTAKSGLFTFVKGLALAGAPHGIRAFCVTPGPVMTRPGMAGMKTLLGTQAEPQELVDYILYLCSENGRCVTGSNHIMDCGRLTMKPQ